jgi:hypothetical protein
MHSGVPVDDTDHGSGGVVALARTDTASTRHYSHYQLLYWHMYALGVPHFRAWPRAIGSRKARG